MSFSPQFNRRGRRGLIRTPVRRQISAFVEATDENRLIPWRDLPLYLSQLEGISEEAIGTAMHRMGYQRVPRPTSIHLTPAICQGRLALANTLVNPLRILWTDETWVTGVPLGTQWLTVRPDEDPKKFASVRMRANGWMFWGSIAGSKKGPCLVWDKSWGKITSAAYYKHIMPLIYAWWAENP